MMVGKELQSGAKAKPGDRVKVSLQLDEIERSVVVPAELKRALAQAKKEETKAARVIKALELLKSGVKRLR